MRETARVLATSPFPDRWRIAEFVGRASTEITTHDEPVVADLAKILPRGTTVYVAHTPKASLDDVVRVSLRAQAAGLRASPHIVARRLASENALRVALARLLSGGVEQVMVIAGVLIRKVFANGCAHWHSGRSSCRCMLALRDRAL